MWQRWNLLNLINLFKTFFLCKCSQCVKPETQLVARAGLDLGSTGSQTWPSGLHSESIQDINSPWRKPFDCCSWVKADKRRGYWRKLCVGVRLQDMIDRIPPPQRLAERLQRSHPRASREQGMTSSNLWTTRQITHCGRRWSPQSVTHFAAHRSRDVQQSLRESEENCFYERVR